VTPELRCELQNLLLAVQRPGSGVAGSGGTVSVVSEGRESRWPVHSEGPKGEGDEV
jgi:hypothetical protein